MKEASTESAPDIQIEGLNADKTRKDAGSDTVYHVYFKLSLNPPAEWRSIFEREWKGEHLTHAADIDESFVVVHGQLHEVETTLLPALKRVIAVTNEAYRRYAQTEATALDQREDVWRQERKDVDAMGASLRFD